LTAWQLFHGDAFDGLLSLKDGAVDVTITDPPYSEHVHGNSVRGSGRKRSGAGGGVTISASRDLGFPSFTVGQIDASARELCRVTKRWILVFCDLEISMPFWRESFLRYGHEVVRVGIWHKIGSAPQFTGDRPAASTEAIVIAHRPPPGRKRWNGGGRGCVWTANIREPGDGHGVADRHPTRKPIALMRALVRDFSEPGELVCDPFAGSASTGVAALEEGRHFLGWEAAKAWAEIGAMRLGEAAAQLPMFPKPRGKARQLTMTTRDRP
jgi:site-specific DNA-methyltransferase (adenine-specific)